MLGRCSSLSSCLRHLFRWFFICRNLSSLTWRCVDVSKCFFFNHNISIEDIMVEFDVPHNRSGLLDTNLALNKFIIYVHSNALDLAHNTVCRCVRCAARILEEMGLDSGPQYQKGNRGCYLGKRLKNVHAIWCSCIESVAQQSVI